jgi:hypothetical protein
MNDDYATSTNRRTLPFFMVILALMGAYVLGTKEIRPLSSTVKKERLIKKPAYYLKSLHNDEVIPDKHSR